MPALKVMNEVHAWGTVIAVVRAEPEDMDAWVDSLTRITRARLDWKHNDWLGETLPQVMYLGSELGRREAIGKLERFSYRLKGVLLLVGCDHSARAMRPPFTPEQAEQDLGADECNHAMWEGLTVSGYRCPGCDTLMFDPGC